MAAIDLLRSRERAFIASGDPQFLDRAAALIETHLPSQPFAAATRLWLSLLRYDLTGDDRELDSVIKACRRRRWGNPEIRPVAVPALTRLWSRDGSKSALDLAVRLGHEASGPPSNGLPLWQAPTWRAIDVAHALIERYRAFERHDDIEHAFTIARAAVRSAREPFVRAWGMRHLAACEHETYIGQGKRRYLEQAIRRYERALSLVPDTSIFRPMMLTELGTALQDRFAEDEMPEDIERAVSIATEAAAADSGRPNAACHLVNLGTALSTRYEHTGELLDLDLAIQSWDEALESLPPRSMYRPMFLDRVAVGYLTRWEQTQANPDNIEAAVAHGRAAFSSQRPASHAVVQANHLAAALCQRWRYQRNRADLDEAVEVLAQAAKLRRTEAAVMVDVLANLAQTYLTRYEEFGDLDDIEAALAVIDRATTVRVPRSGRATQAAAKSRALSCRYQANGNVADLAAAIAWARRSRIGVDHRSPAYGPRVGRLAILLYLRYCEFGRKRDIDEAIGVLQTQRELTQTGEAHDISSVQLGQLAVYLSERYIGYGDPSDRHEANRLGHRAGAADRLVNEPSSTSNLASIFHEEFSVAGSLIELDESIELHRHALARQATSSPIYPAMLNNLGMALQDRYVFGNDAIALDEAIDVHHRAVAGCVSGSPDRRGYLGTLASAIEHRYARDEDKADLDLVIGLTEAALAAHSPTAPGRAELLAVKGSALHQRATITGDPASFAEAVAHLRAALRRLHRRAPARASVQQGYARALAAQHAVAGLPKGRRQVLRAFTHALAASVGAPVVQLDSATSLGEWAAHQGLWPQAASAWNAAAQVRHALFGVQLDAVHGSAWLVRGEEISVAEAVAWGHCREYRRSVIALEGGRAFGLSEALDARSLPDRLRDGGHHGLAQRYERAHEMMRMASSRRRRGWSR